MLTWAPRLAVASALIAACAAATPALGAQVLASTSDSYLAAVTNADGAIASFEAHTTGALQGNAISRDGRFAYIADMSNGVILQYARNRGTGVLTPLSPPSVGGFGGGETPRHLALTRDGTRLLVTTTDGGTSGRIYTYAIGVDGRLGSAVGPASVPGSVGQPVVTPDGRYVYAANGSGGDWIYMWSLGADGTLTAASPQRVAAGDLVGLCVVMAPDGSTVYAPTGGANSGSGTQVVRWAINPATGVLSTADALPSDDGHIGVCEGGISSDGRILAIGTTGMYGTAYARVWPLGDGGHVGTQAPSLTFAPASYALGFALDPTGRFAYGASESVLQSGVGALTPMRITTSGASLIPDVAVGIPTTPWTAVSVAPAQPPVAALAAASGRAGASVRLDASASTDPDTQIATYDWDFGDGTSARDAGPRPEHVYDRVGDYTARVTITNTAGCSTDPAGRYDGRMNSCIGGPSATATARVSVQAQGSDTTPDPGRAGATRPRPLRGTFAVRGRIGTTTGAVPAGATGITQTARPVRGASSLGFVEMARAKSAKGTCKIKRRTYTCTIRLAKGTWTVTTTARGRAGVVAQASRRVVVR